MYWRPVCILVMTFTFQTHWLKPCVSSKLKEAKTNLKYTSALVIIREVGLGPTEGGRPVGRLRHFGNAKCACFLNDAYETQAHLAFPKCRSLPTRLPPSVGPSPTSRIITRALVYFKLVFASFSFEETQGLSQWVWKVKVITKIHTGLQYIKSCY
jgi:hypothetical protein